MPVLKNVKVRWASVTKPNTQFTPQWEVRVMLSKEEAETLKAEAKAVHKKGIKIKEENGELSYRFTRKVDRPEGKGHNNPPVVLGPDGEPFDRLIGNDSICNVQYSFAPYSNKFGEGVVNDLRGVRVVSLVPYGEQDGDGLLDDDTPVKSSKASSNDYDDDDDL